MSLSIRNIEHFRQMYQNMFAELKYFACRYMPDETEAEDVVQDVWIKVWELKKEFDSEAAFKAYIYRAIHNASMLRRRNQPSIVDIGAVDMDGYTMDDSAVDNIIEAEVYAAINNAFNHLTPAARRVYAASLEGKTQKEIAAEFGISVNTVKKHINNANHEMRNKLRTLRMILLLI